MNTSRLLQAFLVCLCLLWQSPACAQEEGFGTDMGVFKVTYYWIAFESYHPGSREVPLLDMKGRTLAMVSESFAREVTMEGTGVLRDGRVINLAEKCAAAEFGWCFMEVNRKKAPYGYGSSAPLKPFRTIAVNDKDIRPGTVLFLPDFIGISFPTNNVGTDYHDGCFVAEDIGWSLENRHIDIFALAENYYRIMIKSTGGAEKTRVYGKSPFCPETAAELLDPTSWVDKVK